MTEIIAALSDLHDRYDAVLCDLWGCYHNGEKPYDAAIHALRSFRQSGGVVVLLTNAPRPDFSTAKQLERMGAPSDTHDIIVTSGDATIAGIRAGNFGATCHHIGPPRDEDLFAEFDIARVPLEAADFILCSGFDDDAREGLENYAHRIAQGVALGLPMVCANPDIIVDRGARRVYCAGAIAQAYEAAGGAVHLYGKPHASIYAMAMQRLAAQSGRDFDKSRVLAIGDGPATDVLGGRVNGFDTVLIAGGLGAEKLLDDAGEVIVRELVPYCDTYNIAPTYTLSFLR